MSEPVLVIDSLNAWRGTAHIVQDVCLTMQARSLSVIGRNGMGKTTLCEAVLGTLAQTPENRISGRISVAGVPVAGKAAHVVARAGVGYVPQGRRVFASLSAEENLRIVERRAAAWTVDRVYELFPRLAERRRVGAALLSGGEQQMLAIGRALLTNPALLVMDEPSEGLAPAVVGQLVEALRRLEEEGMAVLVVEQNLSVALALADDVVVLANGRIAAALKSATLAADPDLQERYLGVAPLQEPAVGVDS